MTMTDSEHIAKTIQILRDRIAGNLEKIREDKGILIALERLLEEKSGASTQLSLPIPSMGKYSDLKPQEAVEASLKANRGEWYTASGVKNGLVAGGFDYNKNHISSAVHASLKRAASKNPSQVQVKKFDKGNGKKVMKFRFSMHSLSIS